jgi:hypothetical protein
MPMPREPVVKASFVVIYDKQIYFCVRNTKN